MDGGLDDGCSFGPKATGCLLEWERRAARREGKGAFEFVDKVCELEASTEAMSLDEDAIADFVFKLGDSDLKGVLDGISKNCASGHWAQALGSTHSGWFRIYQELSRRWDPRRYIESCQENIKENWELSLPVIAKLLGKKAFEEAQSIIGQAARVLLHLREGETWDPRETLLVRQQCMRYGDGPKASVGRFLESWEKVARALGQEDMIQGLRVQEVLLSRWADGEAALGAFRQVQVPKFKRLHDRLFSDWRAMVAEESLGREDDEGETRGPSWVHGLVDASSAGSRGPEMFRRSLRQWFKTLERPVSSDRAVRDLGRLTLDLDTGSHLSRTAPKLRKLLLQGYEGNRPLDATRRRWLVRLGADSLLPEVIGIWKRHAARLVPDPAESSYESCADWLAAILEMDPRSYRKIVRGWGETHRRRRNLWKALAKKGLFEEGEGQPARR
jgi:hypothetical protein